MARGNNLLLPSGSGTLQKTLYAERNTILVLNPNNGVVYVKQNGYSDPVTWDWVVPAQSRAYLPGPWLEYGLWFVDQSGAGQSGALTIFESDQHFDLPDYAAIGVARIQQSTNMDIVEGGIPSNPAGGILRIWADATNHLHLLPQSGADVIVVTEPISECIAKTQITTDVWMAVTLAAGNNVITGGSCTGDVRRSDSLIIANLDVVSVAGAPANASYYGWEFFLNGVNIKAGPFVYCPAGATVTVPWVGAIVVAGPATIPGTLDAGTYTFELRLNATTAPGSASMYLRAASVGTIEHFHMEIVELRT